MSDEQASKEQASKDSFFEQLGRLADAMVAAHGKDFAMGALVLAARYIAEGEARARAAAAAEEGSPASTSLTPPRGDLQ